MPSPQSRLLLPPAEGQYCRHCIFECKSVAVVARARCRGFRDTMRVSAAAGRQLQRSRVRHSQLWLSNTSGCCNTMPPSSGNSSSRVSQGWASFTSLVRGRAAAPQEAHLGNSVARLYFTIPRGFSSFPQTTWRDFGNGTAAALRPVATKSGGPGICPVAVLAGLRAPFARRDSSTTPAGDQGWSPGQLPLRRRASSLGLRAEVAAAMARCARQPLLLQLPFCHFFLHGPQMTVFEPERRKRACIAP